jgi:hypothetical protein
MENADSPIILLLYFEFLLVLFNFKFCFYDFLYPFVLEKYVALVLHKNSRKALRHFVGV